LFYQTLCYLGQIVTGTESNWKSSCVVVHFLNLAQRYNVPPPRGAGSFGGAYYRTALRPQIQRRVCDLLGAWLAVCPDDLREPEVGAAFDAFLRDTLPADGYHGAAAALRAALQRHTAPPPFPSTSSGRRTLEEYSAQDIADQARGWRLIGRRR
jgi:hypothetical protein